LNIGKDLIKAYIKESHKSYTEIYFYFSQRPSTAKALLGAFEKAGTRSRASAATEAKDGNEEADKQSKKTTKIGCLNEEFYKITKKKKYK